MNQRGVTVVIPVWNGRDLLIGLLEKLRLQTLPVAEVLAVDNGSTDGAAEAAEAAGARVLRLGENRGFTGAVNRGVDECRTDLVALVNSDVEPEPQWLARLAAAIQPEGVWFATGKILRASDRTRIDGTWDLLSRGACAWRAGSGRLDGPEFSRPRPIAMAPGTAALFRTELFRRVGPLDTAFESYLEDVDFGLRCALAGFAGVYVPDAISYHQGSASLGKWNPQVVRRIARNQVYLASKHFPLRKFWWPLLVGQLLWGLVALRHGAGVAFLRGKLEGLRRPLKGNPSPGLLAILQAQEREIRDLQSAKDADWYWKIYLRLTSSKVELRLQ